MCKNIIETGRPQMTIWRMTIACWIPVATNTFKLCNIHCFSMAKIVVHTRIIACFVFYSMVNYEFVPESHVALQ
jgi:hypothetical protein